MTDTSNTGVIAGSERPQASFGLSSRKLAGGRRSLSEQDRALLHLKTMIEHQARLHETSPPYPLEADGSWQWNFATRQWEDADAPEGTYTKAVSRALASSEYMVEAMNCEFAFIVIGGSASILWEREGSTNADELRLMSLTTFRELGHNSKHHWIDDKGNDRSISYAEKWLADPDRRTFAGLEFFPASDGKRGTRGFLNLWRGFVVKPSPKGSCAIFLDHLRVNVCGEDEGAYRWLLGWFASIVQRPRDKPGTAIILRGGMGTGKTIVGQVVGSLFPAHYTLADDARYLVGNFNSHMTSCLLFQADEAVWAGDKSAEGRLRGLVTSHRQMIERKGLDPVPVENFLRLLMTTNNDWVVGAGMDERRFAVFDMADHVAQDHGYFGEMMRELEGGGLARLLYELMTFDLSSVALRQIPKTEALLDQKKHSFDPVEAWWFDRLMAGAPTRGHGGWVSFVSFKALVDDYTASADRLGARRKASESELGMKLFKLIPEARKSRRFLYDAEGNPTERVRGYDMPSIERARGHMEAILQQPVKWDEAGDG